LVKYVLPKTIVEENGCMLHYMKAIVPWLLSWGPKTSWICSETDGFI